MMIFMQRAFLALLLITASYPAMALTAVCKEPTGRMLGVIPSQGDKAEIDDSDGMKGGLFTLVWDRGSDRATLITQGAGGGPPNQETGARVLETEDQVSFLVLYEHSVWLYSLFPEQDRLLITSHSGGVFLDGAVIKALQAKCEISG